MRNGARYSHEIKKSLLPLAAHSCKKHSETVYGRRLTRPSPGRRENHFSPSRSLSEEGAFVNVCAFIPRGLTRPPLCRAVVLMAMHAPRASSVGVGGVVAGPGVGPPVGGLLHVA